MDKSLSRGLVILGVTLAIGMSAAAFIFGVQAKYIGSAKQTITVKGLAEQPVESTRAEWQISVRAHGETFEDALNNLRVERPALEKFLNQYGFNKDNLSTTVENVTPNMVDERDEKGERIEVQRGFNGSQTVYVKTDDLVKVQEAQAKIIEYQAKGHNIDSNTVDFLVGNLDEVKLQLIGEATKNAKARAIEFAKNGDVKVGTMRTASQGTFDILPADGQVEDSSGGTYDKSSIHKLARVVVTIEYNIER